MQKCKSKTNINNYVDPVYSVILEDGPTAKYSSCSSITYYTPEQMVAFYKLLPSLAKYYKVTIRIIENRDNLPF